jgi:hypothetical protein
MIEVLLPNYVAKIGDMKSILQIKFLFLAESRKSKAESEESFDLFAFCFRLKFGAYHPYYGVFARY